MLTKRSMQTGVRAAMVVLALGQACVFGSPRAPVDLLVDGVANPLAGERDAIGFSWRLQGTERGAAQTAYQILVCSSRELLAADAGDWWDSGKVASARSASVVYQGKALPAGRRCWWKVRFWDESGQGSAYSDPARFDTGLARGEWTAHYLWDGT